MSTHTPGPWVVECDKFIATPDAIVITELNDGLRGECPKSGHFKANAQLIAAAPAMYLELKEGLVLLEASHHDMVDMYGTDSLQAKTVWERIESTRNTLAQAEGRKHTPTAVRARRARGITIRARRTP